MANNEGSRNLVSLVASRKVASGQLRKQVNWGEEISDRDIRSNYALREAQSDFLKWNEYNVELLTRLFSNDSIKDTYSKLQNPLNYDNDRDFLRDNIEIKIQGLENILSKLGLIPESKAPNIDTSKKTPKVSQRNGDVFIVHGHDEEAKLQVESFLRDLELNPIILHKKASEGKTIIEKFEKYANVSFAIVILSPDDIGASKDQQGNPQHRARQNVISELGYFIGKLGRNNVCSLSKGNLDLPTDILGVIYIPIDSHGGWKLKLAKELKAAGISINNDKLLS